MTSRTPVDRAAMVRRAMVELVAERGIHGTTMSQVARHAGVAAGTAYVHYESKEDLLVAAFAHVKEQLTSEWIEYVDRWNGAREVFESVWRRVFRHLSLDPAAARFLIQLEASPLRSRAHDSLPEDDPLTSLAGSMTEHLVDLPPEILYDLSLAPAVRLAASGMEIGDDQLDTLVESCWRAVAR